MTAENFATLISVSAAGYLFFRWFNQPAKLSPDPWGPEIEQLLHDPQTQPLCQHCFTPQSGQGWFCPVCGSSVGPYNNYMPFVYVFAQGEVMRAGVTEHIRPSRWVIGSYLFCSLSVYAIFAPVYWYRLFQNLRRQKREQAADVPGALRTNVDKPNEPL